SAARTLPAVTIHHTGTNDAAARPAYTKNLSQSNLAADISTSGTLTISDVDSPATFVAQAATAGTYGTFAIDTAGAWTYTASSARSEQRRVGTDCETWSVASPDGRRTAVTLHLAA